MKKKIRLNRRWVSFLFCVLISAFFWMMMTLSKEYGVVFNFPVKYINPPTDKVIANHLPVAIDIEIRAKGFSILAYKIRHRQETVLIDIKNLKPLYDKNHYYLLTNSRLDKITAQFDNDIKIQKIYPDTIFFNFNKKLTRKVPVKANLTVEFDKHYQQSDSVKLFPAQIAVSGAADLVNKVKYVQTAPMRLKNVTDSAVVKLDILKTPDLKLLDISQTIVEAKVTAAKYTEGSMELPVEIENLPRGYNLKIFPDKVTVKYNVAFQNYEKITASQFRVVVDYDKIEEGSTRLKVHLLKFPSEVRAIKLNPEKVEYIIRK